MSLHFFQCFKPWKYYLFDDDDLELEVTEEEFFNFVGYDRSVIPSYFDKTRNKEFYIFGNDIVAWRERGRR